MYLFSMSSIDETLTGIVSRVTYHNPDSGWSVLRVQPLNSPESQETVTVHQTKVFAGATMCFKGAWVINPKYGRQFKAREAVEKKPANAASLEKYLGSGMIKGVGPKTARKIVKYFSKETLDIFEHDIGRLTEVPGIAKKKLAMIEKSWLKHRAIRDVMMYLQDHGISTLFAVKIYKSYGDDAIQKVSENPYRLASDFYGIGFFSADKIALSIGLSPNSPQRITAAIIHVLAASREHGHCYLTEQQINHGVSELLSLTVDDVLNEYLCEMEKTHKLRVRHIEIKDQRVSCYYSKTLYYDESYVAERISRMIGSLDTDPNRISNWIKKYCDKHKIKLSNEQALSIKHIVSHHFSVLTGGPGCGKTTTTFVIVKLLEAMGKSVILAAPTGRAAQRMGEVIGREAKTIHRLLEWMGGEFKLNEEYPMKADFLIVDECSMLDISLTAALLKAVPNGAQVLFIGDADQLPSVGAGNVLKDLIVSENVPVFRLTKIFRQAEASNIIQYAHSINQGKTPQIESPFKKPSLWQDKTDCLFIDSAEATKEQLNFIAKIKRFCNWQEEIHQHEDEAFEFRTHEQITSAYEQDFVIPDKFKHVDLMKLKKNDVSAELLKIMMNKIHPWSSLHYGLTAIDVVVKTYLEWIPKYYGNDTEIQILTPMTRGSLGSANINKVIQAAANPRQAGKAELKIGERIFRVGDRVIHCKNNYDLHVFNGDIGKINAIDNELLTCRVVFYPDEREVQYQRESLSELDLAYAITIHKSQGSEFKAVIMPVLTQHFKMLFRNLVYTGLTRAKDLAVFIGTRQALAMAVRQQDTARRQTELKGLLANAVNR